MKYVSMAGLIEKIPVSDDTVRDVWIKRGAFSCERSPVYYRRYESKGNRHQTQSGYRFARSFVNLLEKCLKDHKKGSWPQMYPGWIFDALEKHVSDLDERIERLERAQSLDAATLKRIELGPWLKGIPRSQIEAPYNDDAYTFKGLSNGTDFPNLPDPVGADLTTKQAAQVLGKCGPLLKLLESGQIGRYKRGFRLEDCLQVGQSLGGYVAVINTFYWEYSPDGAFVEERSRRFRIVVDGQSFQLPDHVQVRYSQKDFARIETEYRVLTLPEVTEILEDLGVEDVWSIAQTLRP